MTPFQIPASRITAVPSAKAENRGQTIISSPEAGAAEVVPVRAKISNFAQLALNNGIFLLANQNFVLLNHQDILS